MEGDKLVVVWAIDDTTRQVELDHLFTPLNLLSDDSYELTEFTAYRLGCQ